MSRPVRARVAYLLGVVLLAVGVGWEVGVGWGAAVAGASVMLGAVFLYDVDDPGAVPPSADVVTRQETW